MATSKRIRKRNVCKYFNCYIGEGMIGGRHWIYLNIVNPNNLTSLLYRESRTKRMIKKCKQYFNYEEFSPLYSRWMIPIEITNPCKKSRIKKLHYSHLAATYDEIPSPDGKFSYTQNELMNLYLIKGKTDD